MREQRLTRDMLWVFVWLTVVVVILLAIILPVALTSGGGESRVEQITHLSRDCPPNGVPVVVFEGEGEDEYGHLKTFTCK